jgi:hypothetical protein
MQNLLDVMPFNLSLLVLNPENSRTLKQVKVLDIFDSVSNKAFHSEGLFSTEIFGKAGDEKRNRLFAYIDLRTEIFHPVIYKALVDLRGLYGEIMAGTAYAVFNPETQDFDPATLENGETGFEFFMKHFPDLKPEERKSTSREFLIRMLNQNRQSATMSRLIVMPAGLRDYVIQPNGKPEEDEINNLYRKILSIANLMGLQHTSGSKHLDGSRYSLQKSVFELYKYIINILEGKGKLIQGWWSSRNVAYSSRNVITSNVPRSEILDDPLTVSTNHTVVGLYQTMMSIFPLAVNLVRNLITDVFPGPNSPALLVNKKTLKQEQVSVDLAEYDAWMTQEGIETQFGRFEQEPLRNEVIEVAGYYLALVYNDGKRVRIVHGVEELPSGWDPNHLTPITYAELYYLAIFEEAKSIPATTTRYPITGMGSIYPCYIYLKTTTRSQCLEVLDADWRPTGKYANEFPIKGVSYVNSMSVASTHLEAADADFDGDMFSLIPLFTEESREEVAELLASVRYYVGVDGAMIYSTGDDVSNLVFQELTS